MPAQDEERLERAERRAGVDLDALDRRDRGRARPATTPAMTSLWPPRNFVADSTTRSAPELERPADVRRGERVVDDVRRAVPVGELGERRRGRRRRSSGWRSSRRRGRASARRRAAAATASRSVMSTNSTSTPKPPNVSSSCVRVEPYDGERRDDPVAGAEQRGERGVDRAHPRGEGDAGLAAGQLGVGRAEGAPSSGWRSGCRRSRRAGRPRRRRAPRRRPRRTSRSGRSGRWSASGRRAGRATRRGSPASRSPWPSLAVAGRCRSRGRCYTGVDRMRARSDGARRDARSPGSCRRASRRTSRRRR